MMVRYYVKSVTPNTFQPRRRERAHIWTASLVFVGFEALVAVGALAIIFLAEKGR